MSGFFSIKETESKDRPGGRKYTCISCGAYQNCISPRMQPYGEFNKKILIVGSSPERIDDQNGLPFQSKYGQHLKQTLEKHGVDLEEDCLSTNACLCCTVTEDNEHRLPTNFELECCRKSVLKLINERKPAVIIILGQSALFSLIGHRWKRDLDTIDKWRGWTIPDQDFKAWICPTYDPKQVVQWKREELHTIFDQDIKQAVGMIKETFRVYKEPEIRYLPDEDLSELKKITDGLVAFDIETNSIKSHSKESKLFSFAICTPTNLYVFLTPTKNQQLKILKEFLVNPSIGKFAHNMKFEHAWIFNKFHVEVQNWKMDTMLVSHLLDNRPGISGLKFQTYVHFGVVDYSSEISIYFKYKETKNANAINRIEELYNIPNGIKDLLKYNALDAYFTYKLAILQLKHIKKNTL